MATANYAYIKDGIVVNVAIFEHPINPELYNFFKDQLTLDDIVLANDNTVIDGTFDGVKFWKIQPYPSWVKDEETNEWIAPVPKPSNDDTIYVWDEETLSWVQE